MILALTDCKIGCYLDLPQCTHRSLQCTPLVFLTALRFFHFASSPLPILLVLPLLLPPFLLQLLPSRPLSSLALLPLFLDLSPFRFLVCSSHQSNSSSTSFPPFVLDAPNPKRLLGARLPSALTGSAMPLLGEEKDGEQGKKERGGEEGKNNV